MSPLSSLLAGIVVLLIGTLINRRVALLSRYNIPDPITGGLLFALVASVVLVVMDIRVDIDQTIKPLLLLMFFAGVGMSADLRMLGRGGRALAVFLVILFPYILVQNAVGVAAAKLLDLHPIFGLVGGSITLGLEKITELELPLGDALVALRQKEADAVIQVIGMPADSVRDALAAVPLRLLPLSERAVTALTAAKAGYFAYRIPQGAYANQKGDVRTIGTAALLLAGADLSDTEVATITRFVFERGRDFAARGSAQGTQVSAANARHGLSIPQHAAAVTALDAPAGR